MASILGLHDSEDDYNDDTNILLISYNSAVDKNGIMCAHFEIPDTIYTNQEPKLHCVQSYTVVHGYTLANNISDNFELNINGSFDLNSAINEGEYIGVKFTCKEWSFILSKKPLRSLMLMDCQQGGW